MVDQMVEVMVDQMDLVMEGQMVEVMVDLMALIKEEMMTGEMFLIKEG